MLFLPLRHQVPVFTKITVFKQGLQRIQVAFSFCQPHPTSLHNATSFIQLWGERTSTSLRREARRPWDSPVCHPGQEVPSETPHPPKAAEHALSSLFAEQSCTEQGCCWGSIFGSSQVSEVPDPHQLSLVKELCSGVIYALENAMPTLQLPGKHRGMKEVMDGLATMFFPNTQHGGW